MSRGDIAARIADRLRKAGASFQAQPLVGGLQPDFLITTPGGRRVVLETKHWKADTPHIARAARQAKLLRKVTNADAAYLVISDLRRSLPSMGVLSVRDVEDVVFGQRSRKAGSSRRATSKKRKTAPTGRTASKKRAKPKRRPRATRATRQLGSKQATRGQTVFAAMPFDAQFDDVFFVAMAHAAKSVGATCVRVDHEDFEGDIVEEIKRLIRRSVAVIADLSGARPNVLYEVGYAHGLPRRVVPICSTPLGKLPFDVRNWNTVAYAAGRTHLLRSQLARRLKAAVNP